jgi:hypothetical protein
MAGMMLDRPELCQQRTDIHLLDVSPNQPREISRRQ